MIEQGIRGGITQCTTRHAVANVPGTDTFNPQHEPSQILDLDVNGLYAATMREALPVSDFEWMTKDEIACLNIDDVPDDAPTGYIPEVSDIVTELSEMRGSFRALLLRCHFTTSLPRLYLETACVTFFV